MATSVRFTEDNSIQHEIDNINRIENSIKSKPTIRDLKETVSLLKDFGIKIDISEIPDFYNVAALQRWRVAIISRRV